MRKYKQFSRQELQNICNSSESYREFKVKLGYSGNSSNEFIRKIILEHGLDTTHFTGQGHRKNIGRVKTITESYLNNEVKITSHKLRLRLIKEGYFEEKCVVCGLSKWLDKPIPLELHHKDGNKDNNFLGNLGLICPNCHACTNTYKSKNRKK